MKFTWESTDIKGGRRVKTPTSNEVWMIGYNGAEESKTNWALISTIDGSIALLDITAEKMAMQLNESGYEPLELPTPKAL